METPSAKKTNWVKIGIGAAITFVVVSAALIVHDKWTAPMLTGGSKPADKKA